MTQSNAITNMVAELNAIVGTGTFKVNYQQHQRRYELVFTDMVPSDKSKKFQYLIPNNTLVFSEMFMYLHGVLMGCRYSKQVLNK